MSIAQKKIDFQADIILTNALKRAADFWGLNNRQLGAIIGLSEPTVSRLKKDQYRLEPDSKQWQISVLFLRIFRGLDAYMGGNIHNQKLWLHANNTALGAAPIALISQIEGLASVLQYIDFMRGQ